MSSVSVAYCTGFWCTNIGNGFYSLGVEHVLKSVLGSDHVTVVSDCQTYTSAVGRRFYPHKNQLEYLSQLDVDYLVLAGPVLSRYFLPLWRDILLRLQARGVGYLLLSAGAMKLDEPSAEAIRAFFERCPPYILMSREEDVYNTFGPCAAHAYNGICFSFFAPDFYTPAPLSALQPYVVCNFDKTGEPHIREAVSAATGDAGTQFVFDGRTYTVSNGALSRLLSKTDRGTDALAYLLSVFPAGNRQDTIGPYRVVRTDHRFHPHYRRKIYRYGSSFCADVPYGYLNLYANAALTLSDRVHACAVTLAFGNSAMLFAKTNRDKLLERVGAGGISEHPVRLDRNRLEREKAALVAWLRETLGVTGRSTQE